MDKKRKRDTKKNVSSDGDKMKNTGKNKENERVTKDKGKHKQNQKNARVVCSKPWFDMYCI